MSLLILTILSLALLQIVLYRAQLSSSASHAKTLIPRPHSVDSIPKVSVIIPAYNEATNIQACVMAVLNSTALSAESLEVIVVDDQSTDMTLILAQTLQQNLGDRRLQVIQGQPRPIDQQWTGKNWACTQAVERATGEFLLFIDADVRLKPGAIEGAIHQAQIEQIDLLSVLPRVVCHNFAEWLVQPILFNTLATGLNLKTVNDPTSELAAAAGPFMFFRRTAYQQIGGHRGVAGEVLEDILLGHRIKQHQLSLRMMMGADIGVLHMYPTWQSLWEGWTKNLYSIFKRDRGLTLYIAMMLVMMYLFPVLAIALILMKSLFATLNGLDCVALGLVVITFLLHYDLRRIGTIITAIPSRFWWLGSIGGSLVAMIAIASWIKTETGWGWTWRGRRLSHLI